eukprot:c53299_g1_i1 orf=235-888(-)
MAGEDDNGPHEDLCATASEDSEATNKGAVEEEDTGAHVVPIVKLEEVTVSTGEENEDTLLEMKAKLYRFDKESNQWKERGVGQVRLLKHKETGKIRLLMRQNKTLKICANHLVLVTSVLQEHAGSDKAWVWHAKDFSDGELKEEFFCIRLGNTESAQKFKTAFEEAQEAMRVEPESKSKSADAVAKHLENLKVEENEVGENIPHVVENEIVNTEHAE